MIAKYLDMREKTGPAGYIGSFVALAVLGSLSVIGIDRALHHNHHLSGIIIFLAILVGLICLSILLTQAVRRVNDMGRAGILAGLSVFSGLCVPLFWFYSPAVIFSSAYLIVVALGVLGLVLMLLPGKAK